MSPSILKKLFIVDIAPLFAQFAMGMSSNLFVNVPLNTEFDFFNYAGGLTILAHIVNGSLILLLGSVIIWYSYQIKNPLVLKLSIFAVALTIIAIMNGVVFLKVFSVPSLYSDGNYFSIMMAMSFLSVFTVIFTDLYVIKKA